MMAVGDPTAHGVPSAEGPDRDAPTAGAAAPEKARPAPPSDLPATIGRYRILRMIGRGGMGAVYEAEQASPRRTVALKVIRAGVASDDLLRRFEFETQVLGRLKHPGIAAIYEAGTFDAGAGPQPYFAMEFVDGEPLDRFVRRRGLDVRARLALVERICDAVHHAHQQGVIHRDLKPGNILVAKDGQPKILDFGVARATDGDLRATTLQTDVGQLVGTVPYMSPEQASGDPAAIDVRSDVYALGVIAYELLAERLPYDVARKMIHEAVRVIREDPPTRLSAINRDFGGDVEIIVGKALEKEKIRRYQSASDLAADIARFLHDEPIVARPPSLAYQVGKLARRHRVAFGAVALAAAALCAATAVSISFWLGERAAREQAQEERAEADAQRGTVEAVNRFLNDDLLSGAAVEAQGPDARVIDVVRAAAEKVDERLHERPRVQAGAMVSLGRAFRVLGDPAAALAMLEPAVRMLSADPGSTHPDTLAAAHELAEAQYRAGRYRDAALTAHDVLVVREAKLGPTHADTLASLNMLGNCRKGLAIDARQRGEADAATADLEEAARLYGEVASRWAGREEPTSEGALVARFNLALVREMQGRTDEAEALLRGLLAVRRRLDPESMSTVNVLGELATTLQRAGRLAEAEPLYADAIALQSRRFAPDHWRVLETRANHARLLMKLDRFDDAAAALADLWPAYRRVRGEAYPDTTVIAGWYAETLGRLGRDSEQLRVLLDVHDALVRAEPDPAAAADAWSAWQRMHDRNVDRLVAWFESHADAAQAEAWRSRKK